MTHTRRKTDRLSYRVGEITKLILAVTALLAATTAMIQSFRNSERLDVHKAAIQQNEKTLQKVGEAMGVDP